MVRTNASLSVTSMEIQLDRYNNNNNNNNNIIMSIFIYRTYHLSSHGGLQFLLKGNQINIIQITNLQPSFYKSDQIKDHTILIEFII